MTTLSSELQYYYYYYYYYYYFTELVWRAENLSPQCLH